MKEILEAMDKNLEAAVKTANSADKAADKAMDLTHFFDTRQTSFELQLH